MKTDFRSHPLFLFLVMLPFIPTAMVRANPLPILNIKTERGELSHEKETPSRLFLREGNWENPAGEGEPISFRMRGNYSLWFPKKNYHLEFGEEKSFLGLGKDQDYALHGPYYDRSLIRNNFFYDLSRKIGALLQPQNQNKYFAPRTRFIELIVNGDFQGLYLLMEKIKKGKDRLNMKAYDLQHPETSSFILKVDGIDDPDNIRKTKNGTRITFVYPKITKLLKKVKAGETDQVVVDRFIAGILKRIETLEATLLSPLFPDSSPSAYTDLVDDKSLVHFVLMQEISKNPDGYYRSIFFHDPGDGKIHFGPSWDFDLSMGNLLFNLSHGPKPVGWQMGSLTLPGRGFLSRINPLPSALGRRLYPELFWFGKLFRHPQLKQDLIESYRQLREEGNPLDHEIWMNSMDAIVSSLGPDVVERNFKRWDVLGRPSLHFWVSPPPWPKTHQGEVEKIKEWLRLRLLWMDLNVEDFRPSGNSTATER